MVAKAGDIARKTGEYKCQECESAVYVEKGEELPPCPCGGETFDEQVSEQVNPATKGKKKAG